MLLDPRKRKCKGPCQSTTRKIRESGFCLACERIRKKEKSAKAKDARQRRTFGISSDEAKLVEEAQDGGCICAPWTNYDGSGKRALSTDHNHRTGVVRGRLCKHCNDLLGRVHDDPAYFRAMIAYITNPPAVRVLGERIVPGHDLGWTGE